MTVCCVALAAAAAPGQARRASAEVEELDPGLVARVNRESLKQSNAARSGSGGRGDHCGQVDIGNDTNRSGSANAQSGRDRTVVVLGPVINTATCR